MTHRDRAAIATASTQKSSRERTISVTASGARVPRRRNDLSAELKLVAACLAWPRTAARSASLSALSDGSVDWVRVLALSERHRVSGLVAYALSAAGAAQPSWFSAEIQRRGQLVAFRELAMAAEMARLGHRFQSVGVCPTVLKGLSVALQYFGRVGLRQNRDIDLLVSMSEVEASGAILLEDGYEQIEPAETLSAKELGLWMKSHKDLVYRHVDRGLIVELHWRLFDNPQLTKRLGAEPSIFVSGPGVGFQALPVDAAFAYMSVHGSQHAWSRLKWLADFAALCESVGEDKVEELYLSLKRAGVGAAAAQGLLLSGDLLGLTIPELVRTDARRSWRLRALRDVALHAFVSSELTELEDKPFGSTWKTFSHYLIGAGPAYWIRQLVLDFSEVPKEHSSPLLRRLGPFAKAPLWVYLRLRAKRGHT